MKKYALRKNLFLSSKKGMLMLGLASCVLSLPAYAVSFGHARLDRTTEYGLDVRISINDLSATDMANLKAAAAPIEQWQANGLTPPVDLNSLRFNIQARDKSGTSVLQVTSDQAYRDTIIDLLLNITTASGIEPYQVSLIVPPSTKISQSTSSSTSSTDKLGALTNTINKPNVDAILVKSGDNMFNIAKRNAVDGVSVYQLMMALQRTNPQAFINNNVNLVKAGASLQMPSLQEMLAISDAQARQQFLAHTNALASGTSINLAAVDGVNEMATNTGVVSTAQNNNVSDSSQAIDRVRLGVANTSDSQVSAQHALADAAVRVSQLEDNVKNLNQALRSQGKAASDLVTEGAKAISDSLTELSDTAASNDEITSNVNQNTLINNGADTAASNAGANGADKTNGDKHGIDVNTASPAGVSANNGENENNSTNPTNSASQNNTESSWLGWLKEHVMGAVTAALALLVLIIVWLLRRFNTRRDKKLKPIITDAMVQEKLGDIDLNLDPNTKNQ